MKKRAIIALLLVVMVLGTTTALAAGGYVSKLTMGHVKEGTEITLPENEPEMDGFVFTGWQINGAGETYPAGATVTVNDDLAGGAKDITFKAVWEEEATPWTVKYAVRIYGIEEDVDEYGNKISLTFGPAGGYNKNYNNSFCAHSGNKDCLHNLTWTEIIEKAHSNPHFFDTCLENGCTHSVKLNITGTIFWNDFNGKQSGDGASCLQGSLNYDYHAWNSADTTAGGWEASMIRNTLNGTETTYGSLSESQALISAFPKELQEAIVPKAVKSAVGIGDDDNTQSVRNVYDIHTTYDKLWLFSTVEMVKPGGTYSSFFPEDIVFDEREGVLYSSQEKMNAVSTNVASSDSVNIFYDEEGYSSDPWARTLFTGYEAVLFSDTGGVRASDADYEYNLSFGFCI